MIHTTAWIPSGFGPSATQSRQQPGEAAGVFEFCIQLAAPLAVPNGCFARHARWAADCLQEVARQLSCSQPSARHHLLQQQRHITRAVGALTALALYERFVGTRAICGYLRIASVAHAITQDNVPQHAALLHIGLLKRQSRLRGNTLSALAVQSLVFMGRPRHAALAGAFCRWATLVQQAHNKDVQQAVATAAAQRTVLHAAFVCWRLGVPAHNYHLHNEPAGCPPYHAHPGCDDNAAEVAEPLVYEVRSSEESCNGRFGLALQQPDSQLPSTAPTSQQALARAGLHCIPQPSWPHPSHSSGSSASITAGRPKGCRLGTVSRARMAFEAACSDVTRSGQHPDLCSSAQRSTAHMPHPLACSPASELLQLSAQPYQPGRAYNAQSFNSAHLQLHDGAPRAVPSSARASHPGSDHNVTPHQLREVTNIQAPPNQRQSQATQPAPASKPAASRSRDLSSSLSSSHHAPSYRQLHALRQQQRQRLQQRQITCSTAQNAHSVPRTQQPEWDRRCLVTSQLSAAPAQPSSSPDLAGLQRILRKDLANTLASLGLLETDGQPPAAPWPQKPAPSLRQLPHGPKAAARQLAMTPLQLSHRPTARGGQQAATRVQLADRLPAAAQQQAPRPHSLASSQLHSVLTEHTHSRKPVQPAHVHRVAEQLSSLQPKGQAPGVPGQAALLAQAQELGLVDAGWLTTNTAQVQQPIHWVTALQSIALAGVTGRLQAAECGQGRDLNTAQPGWRPQQAQQAGCQADAADDLQCEPYDLPSPQSAAGRRPCLTAAASRHAVPSGDPWEDAQALARAQAGYTYSMLTHEAVEPAGSCGSLQTFQTAHTSLAEHASFEQQSQEVSSSHRGTAPVLSRPRSQLAEQPAGGMLQSLNQSQSGVRVSRQLIKGSALRSKISKFESVPEPAKPPVQCEPPPTKAVVVHVRPQLVQHRQHSELQDGAAASLCHVDALRAQTVVSPDSVLLGEDSAQEPYSLSFGPHAAASGTAACPEAHTGWVLDSQHAAGACGGSFKPKPASPLAERAQLCKGVLVAWHQSVQRNCNARHVLHQHLTRRWQAALRQAFDRWRYMSGCSHLPSSLHPLLSRMAAADRGSRA